MKIIYLLVILLGLSACCSQKSLQNMEKEKNTKQPNGAEKIRIKDIHLEPEIPPVQDIREVQETETKNK